MTTEVKNLWYKNMEERWYENKVADKATESTVRSLLNSVEERVSRNKLIGLVQFINKDCRDYYASSKYQAEMLSEMKLEDQIAYWKEYPELSLLWNHSKKKWIQRPTEV
jgi:hypothetical protein